MAHSTLTPKKAKKILKHGSVHDKPLTGPQERFMQARAHGAPVKKKKSLITSGKT